MAEQTALRKKTKRTLAFRHRLFTEVLRRVKSQFGSEEMRLIARFVLEALPHELACRLARRRNLQNPKEAHDWHLAEKARELYRKAEPAELARLLLEAILLGSAGASAPSKNDDLLAQAAALYKVDLKGLGIAFAKD